VEGKKSAGRVLTSLFLSAPIPFSLSLPPSLIMRAVFSERIRRANHMRVKRLAAVYLDTWPFNGHSTVVEALWEGIPVLTLPHVRMAGRVGASVVRAAGAGQHLIARNEDDYIALACAIAAAATRGGGERDGGKTSARARASEGAARWLLGVRESLLRRRGGGRLGSTAASGEGTQSALFDVAGWVDGFETGLRSMWDAHMALGASVHVGGRRGGGGGSGGGLSPSCPFPHVIVH